MKDSLNSAEHFIRGVLNPDIYHGFGKQGPYFEGWYYKLVNPGGDQRWSIIPGVYIGEDKQDSHCFIQIMDGVKGKTVYIKFPFEKFKPNKKIFDVAIGENEFSKNGIKLNIEDKLLKLEGTLEFLQPVSWPVVWQSPGIMGWYAWVPGMECYHGVVSLDHTIAGSLIINGQEVDFSRGRGYIEKDWGRAMPKSWIWLQCNHFSKSGISLTASIADIPWGRYSFKGFIVGLLLNGTLYRFATYTGARIVRNQVDDHEVHLVFEDNKKRLQIIARRAAGSFLKAPTTSQMDRRITESLSAEVEIKLSVRQDRNWRTIIEDVGRFAGLEVVGSLKD